MAHVFALRLSDPGPFEIDATRRLLVTLQSRGPGAVSVAWADRGEVRTEYWDKPAWEVARFVDWAQRVDRGVLTMVGCVSEDPLAPRQGLFATESSAVAAGVPVPYEEIAAQLSVGVEPTVGRASGNLVLELGGTDLLRFYCSREGLAHLAWGAGNVVVAESQRVIREARLPVGDLFSVDPSHYYTVRGLGPVGSSNESLEWGGHVCCDRRPPERRD